MTTTTYARMVDGRAVDVMTSDPAEVFHPDVAEQFVIVPNGTQTGDMNNNGAWTKYVAPSEPAVIAKPPTVTVPQFFLLFTMEEQLSLETARTTDPVVGLLYKRLEDPRLTGVDLSLDSTRESVEYCLSKVHGGPIDDRVAEVLTGIWR